MAWNYTNTQHLFSGYWSGMYLVLIWSLVWKGLALWHAAKRDEKWWFVAFLLIHTVGILELIYLLFIAHAFSKAKKGKKR